MESEKINKIRKLSHFQKQPPVNLEFKDLSYSIPQWRKEPKVILRSVSGQFGAGQLNAVMGPSGSGKTTLLNILSGYTISNASGSVIMNGQPVILKDFYKYSRYIMQEDLLQPYLTIEESMMYAADLKLDSNLSKEHKLNLVMEILDTLGLTGAKDTSCDNLSGGERKRVSIALELINNPPVLFLDEPTSGLDDVSSSHCMALLKTLAEGGRTIICAIHTPSARIFGNFDNVYVLSEGLCVYQGYGRNLISFVSTLGLPCPTHYNPADFIIDIASKEYGCEYMEKSIKMIENGKNVNYCKDNDTKPEGFVTDDFQTPLILYRQNSSIWHQFKVLTRRYCLQTCRDMYFIMVKIVAQIIAGVFIGLAYINIADDASKAISNFGFSFVCLMLCMYLTMMTILLRFPKELKLIKKEHFNKWYGLTAYYLAMSAITMPIHIIITPLYIGTSYAISQQPMEMCRFIPFIFVCILITVTCDSVGLIIASIYDVVNGLFIGPAIAFSLLLLSGHGVGYMATVPNFIKILMRLDFMRYAMELLTTFLYGFDRPRLYCPNTQLMCMFREPNYVLKSSGMDDVVIWYNLMIIIMWFFVFRVGSFFIIRYRLKTDKTIPCLSIFNKFH